MKVVQGRGRAGSVRSIVAWAGLFGVGCSFEHGELPKANAVECDCTFTESASRTLRVQASADDAEQEGSTMDLTSGDLDLDTGNVVGLRFAAFGLPPGALIQSAHVQFTADDTQSGATTATIQAQADPGAPPFTTADNDLTGRIPLPSRSVTWTIPPWVEDDAGADQRTPDLSALIQELVDLPGWRSDSPVVLIFTATGDRTAESFDGDPAQAAELVVSYTTALTPRIPTCATDTARDENGFLLSPQATCDTLEATLSGLNAACGLPSTVECTVVDRRGPNNEDFSDSFQSQVCEEPCTPDPVDAPACTEYDPVGLALCLQDKTLAECKEEHASATHAGDDTPVCVASGSALAFHALGRRSTCEVEGISQITIEGEEPEHDPDTSGRIELLGGPCPGGECSVHPSFLLGMEPVTFEVRFARDPTFEDLAMAGTALESSPLTAGQIGFAPDTIEGTGLGRRGSDEQSVTATNADPLEIGIDWSGRACDMFGTLSVAVGDDGTCEADPAIACSTDGDCASVGGVCVLPQDQAEMSTTVALAGPLVNQPPTAEAGADQALECTSTEGAPFTLDGRGSTDPDGNLAIASWRGGSRTGPELSDDLRTVQTIGVGESQVYVLRVIDTFGQLDEDETSVSVVDTTPPVLDCGAPPTLRPRDPAVSFVATAADTCDASVPATITGFDCFFINGSGKRVSKLHSCKVSFARDTLVVEHSGGVGTHITWTVEATDDSGNVGQASCEVVASSH